MADAIVSKVLNELSSIIETTLVVGVRSEARNLKRNLENIRAVLPDAEIRQFNEASIKQWLDLLKDVTYDLDDLLDEWTTAGFLKSKIDVDEPLIAGKVGIFCCVSCCFRGKIDLRGHKFASMMKLLDERLDSIVHEKVRFEFVLMKHAEQFDPFLTSFIDVTEVKGREEEKREIIEKLLNQSSQKPSLHTISIVGIGGIGKTTLAKLVYNDNVVKTHFEKRIWVCVSDSDEMQIAKAILKSLSVTSSNFSELEATLELIRQCLKEKKFLLVLDDVREENSAKWEQLVNCLNCGSPGSRILLTTRSKTVALPIGGVDICSIQQLPKKESWSIFYQIVSFGWMDRERDQLADISEKIVDKCKGVPLALKVLGSLLGSKRSREEWESILHSKVWGLKNVEMDLFPHLWLSYYDLSPELRQCFSYCAIFPKDHVIEKFKLIELWMAQGYLRETPRKDMESVGEEYFEILAIRFFFQDFEVDDFGSIVRCKMHDLVHDFAQYITKNECFSMKINYPDVLRVDSFQPQARHLRLVLSKETSLPALLYELKKLRSLSIHSGKLNTSLHGLFNQLTCLRLLDLSDCDITEIPFTIRNLLHLRELNLSHNNGLKELPETVCELFNLQILNVNSCGGLEKLPRKIGRLANLRHLNNDGCQVVLPKGIQRLSHLKKLDNFTIGHDNEACSLGDMRNLYNLGGYVCIIGLENVGNVSEATQAKLKEKTEITTLELHFGKEEARWRTNHDQELVEALEPSPKLRSLLVHEYQGITLSPKWLLSLTNLRKLSFKECKYCDVLPPLGMLPSLELLVLWHLDAVKRVGIEFLGIRTSIAFPKLTKLLFLHMDAWEEWIDCEIPVMPCLRSLLIYECPKLKSLPHHLLQNTTKLEELDIINCCILKERYQKGKESHWHEISQIRSIRIDFEKVQGDGY